MNITKTQFKAEKITFSNNFLAGNFKLNPEFKKQVIKLNENEYETKLYVSIKSTQEHPFPIDLEVIFSAIFTLNGIEKEEELDNFLNIGAVQFLFPYVRTAISSITAAALIQPLVLPIVDARQFKNI